MSSKKEGKFAKIMKAPVKILIGARDLYERSLSSCAGHAAFQKTVGPTEYSGSMRSFSVSSRDEDVRELIRAASARRPEAELLPHVPRSRTVTIGRIDEDKPCEFGGDLKASFKSKSIASLRRRIMSE